MAHVRLLLLLYVAFISGLEAKHLPIYIEDSHAGSLGFFADALELDSECTLVLFDAHSDASTVDSSDRIRKGLREVLSAQRRQRRVSEWRAAGVVQPYNWIEPLMPKPFSKVIWVAGSRLSEAELTALQDEVDKHLDWKLQVSPRESGNLAGRYQVVDWQRLRQMSFKEKVAVSIDLDLYATDHVDESELVNHWEYCLAIPQLQALSFAVSRPWLKSDAQGFRLLEKALHLSLGVRNAELCFEPLMIDTRDSSEMAKSYMQSSQKIPRLDLYAAPESLRELLVMRRQEISVRYQSDQWDKLLDNWSQNLKGARLRVANQQVCVDGVWRMESNKLGDILVCCDEAPIAVRWWKHESTKSVYNLAPEYFAGKAFTGDSASYISTKKSLIVETHDPALAATTWRNYLPNKGRFGVLRLQAELQFEDRVEHSSILEIRVREGEGFIGSLSEQFGLPYVFGIGRLNVAGERGGESLVGNDCANFLIYAWRQNGHDIPWSNPKQLRKHLEFLSGPNKIEDEPVIENDDVALGLVVHFGSHVAALWKDTGQKGRLDADDLLVHHLSGFPEVVSLGELITKYRTYDLCRLPSARDAVSVVIGGDVNFASSRFDDPLGSVALEKQLKLADYALVNLECVLSDTLSAPGLKRFEFIAPTNHVARLKRCGVDAVSLANNHSFDASSAGVTHTLGALESAGIQAVGFVKNTDYSSAVLRQTIDGVRVAFVSFNAIDALEFQRDGQAILSYPQHADKIEKLVEQCSDDSDYVIALPHWGEEYTAKVSAQQRALAKWLIQSGADAVVGSHTHYPQHCEYYRGKPIIYSLGNLYFPNRGPKRFNDYHLLELTLQKKGKKVSVHWAP